jgi:hypothetical protein
MSKRRPIRALVCVFATLAAAQAADAAMHATGEFESGATRPLSIAFLPPHAMLIKQKIVQAEQQIEESGELSEHLARSVGAHFTAEGYEVRMLSPDDVNSDPALQELVLDADRRYAEMLSQVRTKLPRQIAKRRYKAGDEMRVLASKLGVDAIGFADMQIFAAAPGASAVAILTGFGAAGSSTMLSVSLIDGRSADIEAYFVPPALRRGSIAGYEAIMADPAGKIAEVARLTLRDLPRADAAARVETQSRDDEVISDVESLLQE